MSYFLEFEKEIAALEGKIAELRHMASGGSLNIAEEVRLLQSKNDKLLQKVYRSLTPWQKVQVARHPERPHGSHYISHLIEDFTLLAGDRCFGEDRSILGGIGRFFGRSVLVLAQEKGHDVETRLRHNFGMPRPEGYRKAIRLMKLAEKFGLPILNFVDTAGAYPGIDAEERGQAEAIARSIETSLQVAVPTLSVIIGEGGSGGAVALATTNVVLMLEHSVYSVISPEGCASILWKDASKKEIAAEAQKLTAQDLFGLKVIDGVVPEPLGGAHRNPAAAMTAVGTAIQKSLAELSLLDPGALKAKRREKFLKMGQI
jgi:acetyl-CoA carboxylase carboxyl transferase subunit alpha